MLAEKPSENPRVADFSQEGRRVACIMGSSGTLGDPKAVMLTEEGLVADALTGLAGYPTRPARASCTWCRSSTLLG